MHLGVSHVTAVAWAVPLLQVSCCVAHSPSSDLTYSHATLQCQLDQDSHKAAAGAAQGVLHSQGQPGLALPSASVSSAVQHAASPQALLPLQRFAEDTAPMQAVPCACSVQAQQTELCVGWAVTLQALLCTGSVQAGPAVLPAGYAGALQAGLCAGCADVMLALPML